MLKRSRASRRLFSHYKLEPLTLDLPYTASYTSKRCYLFAVEIHLTRNSPLTQTWLYSYFYECITLGKSIYKQTYYFSLQFNLELFSCTGDFGVVGLSSTKNTELTIRFSEEFLNLFPKCLLLMSCSLELHLNIHWRNSVSHFYRGDKFFSFHTQPHCKS